MRVRGLYEKNGCFIPPWYFIWCIVQRGQIRVNIHILKVRWEFERGGSMCWLLAFVCEGRWGMNGSILQGADELDITIL